MKQILSLGFLFIVLLSIPLIQSQLFYKKILNTLDPQAKCLDGSPPALYIHQGTEKDKFLLYFNGGGYCGDLTLADTLESCYKRSKTDLGSSLPLNDTLSNWEGILAVDGTDKLYQNWTKVFIMYCDGSLHHGDNQSPIEYKDTKLYFRGSRIVRSHFKYLINTYKMDQSSKIIITGGSAGAVASYLWGNYLQSIVKNPSAVYNIPDSALFKAANTYQTNLPLLETTIRNVMSLAYGNEATPLTQCNKLYPGEQWRCVMPQVNHPFLKGKYLFIQSQYDWWGIYVILQIKCLKYTATYGYTLKYCSSDEIKFIQDYRTKYLELADKIRTSERGLWSIACSKHTYAPYKDFYDVNDQRVPQNTGMNVKQAIQQFVFQDKINWTVDANPWPSNQPCAY